MSTKFTIIILRIFLTLTSVSSFTFVQSGSAYKSPSINAIGLRNFIGIPSTSLLYSNDGNNNNNDIKNSDDEDDKPLRKKKGDANEVMNDTKSILQELKQREESIQVEKMRKQLEDDNMKRLLKRRPIKLPYEDARRWVQANLGPNTKEEFFDLVANGNLRTPYIPKNPEGYYKSTNEWISWDHFLTGLFDTKTPSSIRPASGIFD